MAADYSYLPASSGGGDAILMHIAADRAIGATTILVDSVVNVPAKFTGTAGTLLATGFIDPTTKTDFKGHVDTGSLIIDSFAPGNTDVGNTLGQVVIIKPSTPWANDMVTLAQVAHNNDGTIKTGAVLTSPKIITSVNDTNNNELLKVTATSSAVNEMTLVNAATGTSPQIQASGDDSNVDIRLSPKGTGNVKKGATGGSIDWWEELGRTTLSGSAASISLASFTAKKYLKVIYSALPTGGSIDVNMRFNNDSAANYTFQTAQSNGADASATSQAYITVGRNGVATQPQMGESNIVNILAQEKLVFGHSVSQGTAGAANATLRMEHSGKWANTAAQITRVDLILAAASSGTFAIGSELIVLGHD